MTNNSGANKKIKAAIVGATGYTGSELVRLLSAHPQATISAITSLDRIGTPVSEIHSHLLGAQDVSLSKLDDLDVSSVDVVFLALPHRVSMDYVCDGRFDSVRVIDLSADFRLDDAKEYEEWYGVEHKCGTRLADSVYGLPELNRAQVKDAMLVGNPGCYPTSAILPLAPLLNAGLVSERGIVVDSKSGVTGAGVRPSGVTHFPSVNDNFMAYGIGTHRHTPEIQSTLASHSGKDVLLQFTPHLLPVNRGILTTIYADAPENVSAQELRDCLDRAYDAEPFVHVMDTPPRLSDIRGSNFCKMYVTRDHRTGRVIIVSVLDNLVKGAAGQAVQNMNIMFGMDECAGLMALPLAP